MEQIIQRAVAQLLLDQAHKILQQPHTHYVGLKLRAHYPEECRNKDFEALETMTEINISTLKRFMSLSTSLNYQNKQKILQFMNYLSWDTLVIEVVRRLDTASLAKKNYKVRSSAE